MRILSIETSCDETAVSVVLVSGAFPDATYTLEGNALLSQVDIHKEFGGVFPMLAKREHIKTITPLFEKSLSEAGLLMAKEMEEPSQETLSTLYEILNREPELADVLLAFYKTHQKPEIDLIAVTAGPGLEPALWVGLNFAKALAFLYDIPVVPVNHMEGHVLTPLFNGSTLSAPSFPALALLISGGHTELLVMRDWTTYERVGQTRDDAVGEAFDKVARLIGLPYPGGPKISAEAVKAREASLPPFADLPRPMLNSGDLDFSFSGLKTAVRYAVEGKELSPLDVQAIARDFEDAVTEVLLSKVQHAIEQHGIQSLIIGGGVSANTHIGATFKEVLGREYPDLAIYIPESALATDNSIMIALAGHARARDAVSPLASRDLRADGNLSLA